MSNLNYFGGLALWGFSLFGLLSFFWTLGLFIDEKGWYQKQRNCSIKVPSCQIILHVNRYVCIFGQDTTKKIYILILKNLLFYLFLKLSYEVFIYFLTV